jgi:orotidine-5'-phosphate decarboxylase
MLDRGGFSIPPRPPTGDAHASIVARERLCVALDFASKDELLSCAKELAPHVGWLKIGLEAFVSHGPDLVREVAAFGPRVFLDLKLHDIPNTVAGAAAAATRTGAAMLNIHASGGLAMMRAAGEAALDAARKSGTHPPRVIGVTVLTSLDAASLAEAGFAGAPRSLAARLAVLARAAGLHGVVTSAEEVEAIRAECGPAFFLVVPGIRPAGAEQADQRRVASPADAIRAGADLLVVGRPITGAKDRAAAARAVLDEIRSATAGG